MILSLYFADDCTFVISASSWNLVEAAIMRLFGSFSTWCRANGMKINVLKSTVCFLRRKSPSSPDFGLKNAEVDCFRCLGVMLDKNFCFLAHVNFLKKWIQTRCNVIRLLRGGLKISADVLLRVSQTFRSRMLFGTWWILCCSKTSFSQLQVYFTKCIRASVGFNRFVPVSTVSAFTGIDLLSDYTRYWLGSRSAVDFLRDNFDMFHLFKSEELHRHPSKNNLRNSTIEKSCEATRKDKSIFPENAVSR